MRLPTPADLCWNVKCSPEQEWIERTLRIAVENVWPQALEAAHSRNGHGSHVVEIVESAIEHAVCRLKTGDPLGPEQVTQLLQRLVLQEVRRRRRASGRMVFVGSSEELPPTPVRNPQIQIDCALDLEIIPTCASPFCSVTADSGGVKSPLPWELLRQPCVSVANERLKESAKSRKEYSMNHDCRIVSFISKGRRDFD